MTDQANDGVTDQGSESENPAIDAPTPKGHRPRTNQDWWPNQIDLSVLHKHAALREPAGRRVRLRRADRDARRRGAQARHRRGDDHLAGVVAGRLRPLRAALHPDELARRGHLPHRGRARRRGRRPAAVRAPEQLARQRQPRQGPPRPVAGQAEVRPAGLVGRPPRPRRQRRARGHGLHDLRVRLRPQGRLGARGGLLGSGGHLARRRALQRRPRADRPVRRRPDGPDLRQPGGPQRRARPAEVGARHPRDVRPDGDERRGDRGAHRRRPHLRQDPRGRRPRPRRAGARGLPGRAPGHRLEEPVRFGQGPRHHHERDRGHLDPAPDAMEQRVLREPLRLRVGADEEPGRRAPVAAQGRRGREHRARPGGRLAEPPADDAHDRPRAAPGPRVREDLAPLPRGPRRVRAGLRQGLVQAPPPRHGPHRALPRPVGPGAPAVAGPGAGRGPRARVGAGRRRPEGGHPRYRPHRAAAGPHGVGLGGQLPRHRQARRRERCPHPPRAAARLGLQRRRRDLDRA